MRVLCACQIARERLVGSSERNLGAGRGNRTPKGRSPADFESAASASSAIPAEVGSDRDSSLIHFSLVVIRASQPISLPFAPYKRYQTRRRSALPSNPGIAFLEALQKSRKTSFFV